MTNYLKASIKISRNIFSNNDKITELIKVYTHGELIVQPIWSIFQDYKKAN
jgi:hypothetical protein